VGLESWLADTIESSGFDGPVVDASQGVRLRQVGGEPDPHIWQDPGNAMVMAANIERGLARVEPAGADAFQANLAAYTTDLEALDAGVEQQTASLASRKVVTNHDAFGYYLDRYHLQLVRSVLPTFARSSGASRDPHRVARVGSSPPSFGARAERSGRDIRELVARIRATGAKAIF